MTDAYRRDVSDFAAAFASGGQLAPCAVVATDTAGRIIVWSPEAERLYGWTHAEVIGRHVGEIAPDWARSAGDALIDGRRATWEGESLVRHRDGGSIRVCGRATPIIAEDKIVAVVGESLAVAARTPIDASLLALAPGGAAHVAAHLAEEWYRSFLEAAHAALSPQAMDDATSRAFAPLADALDADALALLVKDPDGEDLIARVTYGWERQREQAVRVRAGEGLSGRVLQSRRPLIVEDLREDAAASQVLRESDFRSFAAIPLIAGTRAVGVLYAVSRKPHHFGDGHVAALWLVGGPLAATIERVNLLAAERRARRRAERSAHRLAALRDLAMALAGTHLVAEVGRIVLDVAFARELSDTARGLWEWTGNDLGLIASVGYEDDWRSVVGATEYPAALAALTSRIPHFGPIPPGARSGESPGWGAVLPLLGEDRVHGLLTLTSPTPREFSTEQREYLMSVAAQAGVAIHRAKLAEADLIARAHERRRTAKLLRAISPAPPAAIPGLAVCGHYRPADEGPVGGDWFDAFPLADGCVAIAVGDVAGHGFDSVTAMLLLRHALYAYAHETRSPKEMLRRLHEFVNTSAQSWPEITTLVFGIYDPGTRRLVTASAGHPPWLLVRGDVAEYATGVDVPLSPGLAANELREYSVTLEPGDLLVFYTDGLIEVRGEPLAVGFERLAIAAIEVASEPLPAVREALLEATAGSERTDDLSLLLLRVVGR